MSAMNVPLPEPYHESLFQRALFDAWWENEGQHGNPFNLRRAFAAGHLEGSKLTAEQLRQHEATVREQIAGEIAKLPLPYADDVAAGHEVYSFDQLAEVRLAASSIALGTTPKG